MKKMVGCSISAIKLSLMMIHSFIIKFKSREMSYMYIVDFNLPVYVSHHHSLVKFQGNVKNPNSV